MAEKLAYEELERRIHELEQVKSEHKQMEESLRLSERRYRVLAEHSLQGIAVLKGNPPAFVYVNPKWVEIFGYTSDEALSMSPQDIWKMVHIDDRKLVRQRNSDRLMGKPVVPIYEFRIIRKDDAIRWVEVYANRIEDGDEPSSQAVYIDITERKQAEKALQESTQRYREVFENSRDGFVVVDTQQRFLNANQAYCEMLGYSLDELKTKNDFYAITPEYWRKWEHDEIWCNRLLKTGASGIYEKELIRKDGTIFPVELQKFIVRDHQSNPCHLWGIVRDITDRKKTERILKEIITKNPMSIQILDKEGCTLEVNPSYKSLFGSVPPPDYSIFNDHQLIQKGMGKLFDQLRNGETVHFPELYFNAHDSLSEFPDVPAWIRTIGFPLYGIGENSEKFVFMHENITERKKSEVALQESEQHISSIFRSAPVGIGMVVNRVLKSVNRQLCEMTGYEDQEITGQSARILYPSDDEFEFVGRENYTQIKAHGTGTVETRWHRKDGTVIDVLLSSTPMDIDDWSKGVTFTALDITERKKAEAEKLIAQKMADEHKKQALVGQIAGKMAHDFNNILGIVMGNTELALLDCLEPNTKKTLELIYEQTIRGKNLTKNLVAFAKDQEPKQEFFRISDKIDLVLNLMRKDLEGIELIKEVSPGAPELLADPGMIEHALVNLIQNSIHALSMVEYPRIIIRTYGRDNDICFEIEDNGCGISKVNLEHIYEPSFSLKGSRDVTGSYKAGIKGTGYGMSNVKKYIELHKGRISVDSELGSGTNFIISLPIIKKELTVEEKTEIRKGKSYFGKYILLVEDETAIADVQYRILTQEPCSHKVDIANNGKVAIDLFGRNQYDFVSLDYVLPGNINGMDVYHHIRETNITIPVLFISGNIEFLESIKDLKRQDSYIDHVSKPCKNIDYIGCINKMLGSVEI